MIPAADPQHSRFNPLRMLVLHFRPRRVAEKTLDFKLTWGLGGMAVLLVSLQLFTGVLLKFAYEPVPAQAYASLVRLQEGSLFGQPAAACRSGRPQDRAGHPAQFSAMHTAVFPDQVVIAIPLSIVK